MVKECLISDKVENMAEAKNTQALVRWMIELTKELNKQRDRLQAEGMEGLKRASEERNKWQHDQAMSFWKLKKELLLDLQKLGKLGAEPENVVSASAGLDGSTATCGPRNGLLV